VKKSDHWKESLLNYFLSDLGMDLNQTITLARVFLRCASHYHSKPALLEKKNGKYRHLTYNEVLDQAQDFAGARREYDRTLLFGRGHASSADAMFWRASSLFRLDDCAAAIPAYEELITRVPENVWAPESQYQIGVCETRLGHRDAAAAAFRRTLAQYESSRWSISAADRLRELEMSPTLGAR